MTELFDAVSVRLKAIFTAHAALELEAEVIACHVERKAALFKQAAKLEEEGLKDLAAELRQHAGGLDPRRPAETVLPMLTQTPTTTQASNEQTPVSNGVVAQTTEPSGNGVLPVPAPTVATEPSATANGTESSSITDPEPSASPLPVAVPAEPTPELSSTRSTSRKKSR